MSGTPWGCRPSQLSGTAQSKGLDAGRTNAGQSPQEQGGPRSRKDRKPSVRAPEATVPGSEIAARWSAARRACLSLAGEMRSTPPRGVSGRLRRCASRRSVPLDINRGTKEAYGAPAPQRTGVMTHAYASSVCRAV